MHRELILRLKDIGIAHNLDFAMGDPDLALLEAYTLGRKEAFLDAAEIAFEADTNYDAKEALEMEAYKPCES